jgi:pSer/pThr/pTyr-binding forkhead associated (FHA) protein
MRQFALKGNLFIFGQPKTMFWPDGRSLQLTDGETIAWQGEPAVYVAIEGHHVSGLHLALRLYESGFDFQDLGSSNGTFDGKKAIRPIVWLSALQAQTLHLGGPDQDAARDTPRLSITAGLEMAAQAAQPTPLRSSIACPTTLVFAAPLLLHLEGSNGWRHAQQVSKLPYQIGRAASCDCVVPSEFSKVSRNHFVIEAWDSTNQLILIRDTSTHGVLIQHGSLSGHTRNGAWLSLGGQILIGSSKNSPWLLITFTVSASKT